MGAALAFALGAAWARALAVELGWETGRLVRCCKDTQENRRVRRVLSAAQRWVLPLGFSGPRVAFLRHFVEETSLVPEGKEVGSSVGSGEGKKVGGRVG